MNSKATMQSKCVLALHESAANHCGCHTRGTQPRPHSHTRYHGSSCTSGPLNWAEPRESAVPFWRAPGHDRAPLMRAVGYVIGERGRPPHRQLQRPFPLHSLVSGRSGSNRLAIQPVTLDLVGKPDTGQAQIGGRTALVPAVPLQGILNQARLDEFNFFL